MEDTMQLLAKIPKGMLKAELEEMFLALGIRFSEKKLGDFQVQPPEPLKPEMDAWKSTAQVGTDRDSGAVLLKMEEEYSDALFEELGRPNDDAADAAVRGGGTSATESISEAVGVVKVEVRAEDITLPAIDEPKPARPQAASRAALPTSVKPVRGAGTCGPPLHRAPGAMTPLDLLGPQSGCVKGRGRWSWVRGSRFVCGGGGG